MARMWAFEQTLSLPRPAATSILKKRSKVLKGPYAEVLWMRSLFRFFSNRTAEAMGSPWAFVLGLVIVLVWGVTGPYFRYSDTWQLVINTGTTIITFLMVFLIQNTQNRDARAVHLKLDELIRALKAARTQLVNLENMTDDELDALQSEFKKLSERTEKSKKT